jgi:uncharacterized membrane protein YqhA
LHEETLKHVVGLVDSFLVAIFLLLFAYGLYELFVSELDPARKDIKSGGATMVLGLLPIRNLDDLKSNLVKVITAILIVTLFEHAVAVDVGTPIELVYFAATILLVALALYVVHLATNLRLARSEVGSNDEGSRKSSATKGKHRELCLSVFPRFCLAKFAFQAVPNIPFIYGRFVVLFE